MTSDTWASNLASSIRDFCDASWLPKIRSCMLLIMPFVESCSPLPWRSWSTGSGAVSTVELAFSDVLVGSWPDWTACAFGDCCRFPILRGDEKQLPKCGGLARGKGVWSWSLCLLTGWYMIFSGIIGGASLYAGVVSYLTA